MAAAYPAAVKTFSAIVNGVTKLVAALFNSPYDEITAIETELGVDPAGSVGDVATRLAAVHNPDGTLKNVSRVIAGWVNFGGASGTIADSFNVSSITDNGTGDFTANWDTDFANTGYSCVGTCSHSAANDRMVVFLDSAYAVGSVRLNIRNGENAIEDVAIITLIALGDQ